MLFLRRCWQVGAASPEGHGQTAVDDPDFLEVDIDEGWQEAIQRNDERCRLLVANQRRRELALHQAEKELGDGDSAERRGGLQGHAHRAAFRFNRPDFRGERDGQKLYYAGEAYPIVDLDDERGTSPTTLELSPDGKWAAYYSQSNAHFVKENGDNPILVDGEARHKFQLINGWVYDMKWLPATGR